jgi:hypothetical protein
MAGGAYVVGQRRPELFAAVSGRVIPRVPQPATAGREVHVHQHYHGMPAEGAVRIAMQRLGWELDRWGLKA